MWNVLKNKLIQTFLIPLLLKIVRKTLESKVVTSTKTKIFEWIKSIIARTDTKFDDKHLLPFIEKVENAFTNPCNIEFFIDGIMEIVEEIFTGEPWQVWAATGIQMIRDVVIATETEWDDKTILPVLDNIEEVLNLPDND